MHIDYLDHLPDEFRASAVRLALTALRDKFEPILGDDRRAQDVLGENLDTTRCLAAICARRLVGMLAIQDHGGGFFNPRWTTMLKTYGLPGGVRRMCGLRLLHHRTGPDEFYVDGIVVADDMRGRGVGSRLLAMLEEIAASKGGRAVSLEVIDTNPRARALYERIGYTVTRRRSVRPIRAIVKFPFEYSTHMVKRIG